MAIRLVQLWAARGGGLVPIEEQLQIERLLAAARLFLAAVALLAVYFGPDEPTLLAGVAYGLLASYLVFAVAVFLLLRGRPLPVLRWRSVVHALDVAAAAVITVLTQGAASPFFVFFIFVLLGAALRWGSLPTVVTGATTVVWYLVEGVLHDQVTTTGLTLTRFMMRAAYLSAATLILAYLAGRQTRLRTEAYAITSLFARIKSSDRFAETVHTVFDECLAYSGATSGTVALEEEEAGRLYIWYIRRTAPGLPSGLSLTELPISDRENFFVKMPANAAVWHVVRKRRAAPRARFLTLDGTVPPAWADAASYASMLDREGADSCIVVRGFVTGWQVRMHLFNPAWTDDGSLRFVQRFAGEIAPALHSEYLVTKLRTKIGEVERARMSRELHDGLIQSLLSIELQLGALRRRVPPSAPETPDLQEIQQELHRAILDTRDLMAELRPAAIHRDGLLAEISGIIDRFRTDSGTDAHLVSDIDEIDCAPKASIEVARIVREALINVRKHARARHVTVRVSRGTHGWELVIDDDGQGFGFVGRRSQEQLDRERSGPVVIKERVRAIGGTLTIDSEPGRGSRLEITWPFRRRFGLTEGTRVGGRPVGVA